MLPDGVVENFGRNVAFRPALRFAPRSEEELLQVLRENRGRSIRAVGRLHAWSEAAVSSDVLLDLRNLNSVTVNAGGDTPSAEVGAGCQIHRLLSELDRQGGFTTPSLGLITEQAIAGATATGTHGSGRHSLSHYVLAARVAYYDPATGEPRIHAVESGDELRAVRCSLGCLGIVVSVTLPIRRQYNIEEHFRRYGTLDEVLAAEEEFPLQQFFLVPWWWDYFAQHRRESERPRSLLTPLYRLYWAAGMDVAFHLGVLAMARWLPRFCTRMFYRAILPWLVPRRWRVVDRSDRQLTMNHSLFRHIEIEVFVPRSRLAESIPFVQWLIGHCAGESVSPPASVDTSFPSEADRESLSRVKGSYQHHYPICVRKVLPDDALISMAEGNEPWYAMSFISYARPHQREGFFAFASLLARGMAALCGGRPHWGKYCPLDAETLARLYPRFDDFRRIARDADANGTFQNGWTRDLLSNSEQLP